MPDPYEPGWRPSYTGDDSLGDVGTGFGADLYELFKAGRVLFPQTAREYSTLASRVHRIAPDLAAMVARGAYTEPADSILLELREDLQEALAKSCTNIDVAGRALVEIAVSYAQTDEDTAEGMAKAMDDDAEYQAAAEDGRIDVPPPPAPGDPLPPAPEPEQSGDSQWS